MRIESAVARGALTRQAVVFLVPLVFGGWFAYDGWIGYPNKNMNQAKKDFPVVPEGSVPQKAAVTAEAVTQLQAKLKADPSRQITLTDLGRQEWGWGEPAYLGPAEVGGAESGQRAAYFVGTYGWARALLTGDAISSIEWRAAEKDPSAIAVQKLLAGLLIAGSLIPLWSLLGMVRGKCVLDDDGLSLPGKKPIRYSQMTAIDLKDVQQRGLARLTYQDAGGLEATAVLDEERIEKFEEILLNLCEKKGWHEQLEQATAEPPTDAAKKDDNGH